VRGLRRSPTTWWRAGLGPALGLVAALVAWSALGASPDLPVQTPPDSPPELAFDSLDGLRYGRLEAPELVLRFAPRDTLVAREVLDFLLEQRELPGLPTPAGVTAVLAHSPAALDALTGGVVPEWRGGVAVPSLGLLVVPTGEGPRVLDPQGRRVLRHEWAHLGLHGFLGDLRAPRWFDEGYAQWASGGFDAGGAWRLRLGLATGAAPAFDSLTLDWPRRRAEADMAYLLAASAVTYLLGESGERGLELFLGRWREGRSFESAFRQTFGVTTGQFEEDWKEHVKDRYGWLFVLSHSTVFWAILSVVLLVLVRFRWQYNKDRMARLRAEELPDRPAWWDGEEVLPDDEADHRWGDGG